VARKHKPILLSTGCSTLEDIDRAVEAIRAATEAELILMHCTAAYPCPDEEANLRVIPSLAQRYGCRVGFSDHTLGIEIALAAVALGAVVIEKHFSIDGKLPGGDNALSILPEELKSLCICINRVQKALGSSHRDKTATESRLDTRVHRSLVVRRDMKAGEVLRVEDLDATRPGGGVPSKELDWVLGRKLARACLQGQQLMIQDLQ
jgi:sialic acid synthase SpsE